MKALDMERISKITAAINEIVPNLDTKIVEGESEITLTLELPKAGVVGRPKKIINIDSSGYVAQAQN